MILKLYVSRSFCQVEVWRPTGSIIVSCIVISHVDTIKVNFYLFFFQWNANKNSREISCRHGHQIFFIFWEKKKHFVEVIKNWIQFNFLKTFRGTHFDILLDNLGKKLRVPSNRFCVPSGKLTFPLWTLKILTYILCKTWY